MSSTWDAWTYRSSAGRTAQSADIVGYEVHATDGHIGKVDEATYDVGSSQIVVDTGPWIFGRKVMIPAGTIERIDLDNRMVHLNLTKDQIKDSPEFDPARIDDEYRTRLDEYYRRTGWTRAA